uniref:uncharacterized protein LOC122587794 n=1 Tax=Erigeron canadensis TaxID=72917 RepID=UPI001CB8C0C9|nr:uncharacterized protein LOC122587794 [Erigeron canadensis]
MGKASHWCSACRAHHSGPCLEKTKRCDRCGKQGHVASSCKDKVRCYKCGEMGNLVADCPQKKDGTQKAKTRAYQMTTMEEEDDTKKHAKDISTSDGSKPNDQSPQVIDTIADNISELKGGEDGKNGDAVEHTPTYVGVTSTL